MMEKSISLVVAKLMVMVHRNGVVMEEPDTYNEHFHAQCNCDECEHFVSEEFTKLFFPSYPEKVIIPNIKEIRVHAKTKPWQECRHHCRPELEKAIDTRHYTDGDFKYKDVAEIVEKITNDPLFLMDGGNGQDIYLDIESIHKGLLKLDIITCSEEGHKDCEHTTLKNISYYTDYDLSETDEISPEEEKEIEEIFSNFGKFKGW